MYLPGERRNGVVPATIAAGRQNDTPVTTVGLIDAVIYHANDSTEAGLLPLLNPGQLEVNENGGDDSNSHSNQRSVNGSGGTRNTSNYVRATPTPGAINVPEPASELLAPAIMLTLAACRQRARRA